MLIREINMNFGTRPKLISVLSMSLDDLCVIDTFVESPVSLYSLQNRGDKPSLQA